MPEGSLRGARQALSGGAVARPTPEPIARRGAPSKAPLLRERRLPDRAGIIADGPVRGKPAHTGDIHNAGLCPIRLPLVQLIHAPLGVEIIVEIGSHEIVVDIPQRLAQSREALYLTG